MGRQCKDLLNARPSKQMLGGEKLTKLKTFASFAPGCKFEKISFF